MRTLGVTASVEIAMGELVVSKFFCYSLQLGFSS